MALRKKRAEDNGSSAKYKRSFFGDVSDVIKLLTMSGVIGGGGWATTNYFTKAPAYTNAEQAVFHNRVETHMAKSFLHEDTDQKTIRIRAVVDREYKPVMDRLEEKIDALATEIRYIKRRVE